MKKVFILLLLMLSVHFGFAEEKSYSDSLATLIDTSKNQINIAKAIFELSRLVSVESPDSGIHLLKSNVEAVNELLNSDIQDFQKDNLLALQCKNWILLAEIQEEMGLKEEWIVSLEKAKEIAIRANTLTLYRQFYNSMASLYQSSGNFTKALIAYDSVLKYATLLDDKKIIAFTQFNLGAFHNSIRNYDQSIQYTEEALKIFIELKICYYQIMGFYNLTCNYLELKDYVAAKESYSKIIELKNTCSVDNEFETEIYLTGGDLYFSMDSNYNRAHEFYDKAFLLFDKINFEDSRYGVLLSKYAKNIFEGDYSNKKEIEQIYYETKKWDIRLKAAGLLQEIFFYEKDILSYKGITEQLLLLKDSIYQDNIKTEALIKATKHEYNQILAEQKCEIESNNLEIDLLKYKNKNKWYLISLISILCVFLGVFFYIKNNRSKEKIKHTKKLLEAKRKEVLQILRTDAQKNNTLRKLEEKLTKLEQENSLKNVLSDVHKNIASDLSDESQWDLFVNEFQQLHTGFLAELIKNHSSLTYAEKKLCSLIKMNLNNQEIADVLCIENSSVRIAKTRLKKKLSIEDSLDNYIQAL